MPKTKRTRKTPKEQAAGTGKPGSLMVSRSKPLTARDQEKVKGGSKTPPPGGPGPVPIPYPNVGVKSS